MKRGMKGLLIAGGLLVCLIPVMMIVAGILGFVMGPVEYMPSASYLKDELGINRDAYIVLHEQDDHGGFHGDGLYAVALDCTDHTAEIEVLIAGWRELPLPENLELLLYGGEREGVIYGHEIAGKAGIPRVENGCYYFNNRHSKAMNNQDEDIFGKYSYNLSVAILDRNQNILYLLCYDT